jgi:TPR repeat protein
MPRVRREPATVAAVDYFAVGQNYGLPVVLGYLYDTGLIVVRDPSQAADWYRKAADAGDTLAQWLLGRLYVVASGLPRDDSAAQKWLTVSANQKNPFAAYLLGSLLSARDYAQAPHWFQMAAERASRRRSTPYAWTLKEGRGINRDRVKSLHLVSACLEGGYPAAAERPWTIGGRALPRPDRSSQNRRAEVRGLRQPLHRSSRMHRVGRRVQ